MNRHFVRVLTVLAVLAGLVIHIGLGSRVGLFIAAIGLAAHLIAALMARLLLRRKAKS